jgi:hypothetical protein
MISKKAKIKKVLSIINGTEPKHCIEISRRIIGIENSHIVYTKKIYYNVN